MKKIDVNYCFIDDFSNYWDNYWSDEILGHSSIDPDSASNTLLEFDKILYSRQLPNGERMNLEIDYSDRSLKWDNLRLSNDSIMASFRYKNERDFIQKVADSIPNWKDFIKSYIIKSYTIGGEVLFPKRMGGINQSRGTNKNIRDRFDLTLDCIRKYYMNEKSPLYDVLIKDKAFFDKFVDFKGYVDFFFLQDFVNEDYSKVNFLIDEKYENVIPNTVEDYFTWMKNQENILNKRNSRINEFLSQLNVE